MTGPQTVTAQQLERSRRLLQIAEQFYRCTLLDDRVALADLPPALRRPFIQAAERGWDYLQHGDPPV